MDLEAMEKMIEQAPQGATGARAAPPDTVEGLCEEIAKRRAARYAERTKPYPRSNPIASDISDCQRETVLAITNWQDRPDFPIEAVERTERGNQIENWIVRELMDLGYTVRVERQPFEIRDKVGRLLCRGKTDGFISLGHRREVAFEAKSLFPAVFARINVMEDWDKYHFFRKYPRQLQSYLYANNMEEGMWVVDDCLGHWKLIPCRLDYARAEKILAHLEGAVEHLADNTLPDFHKDPQVCIKCWAWKRVCTPPFASGEGMQAMDAPELAMKLARMKEIEEAHREYERYDKEAKKVFKAVMHPEQTLIIGDYMVTASKEHDRKGYSVEPTKYVTYEVEKIPF